MLTRTVVVLVPVDKRLPLLKVPIDNNYDSDKPPQPLKQRFLLGRWNPPTLLPRVTIFIYFDSVDL